MYSYTPWSIQLSYTQLTDILSCLREYLHSVIGMIRYEYLVSILINSYSLWRIQLTKSSTQLPGSYSGGLEYVFETGLYGVYNLRGGWVAICHFER